jgi:predicted  nucleic acid-binding Zn-ribbon protein
MTDIQEQLTILIALQGVELEILMAGRQIVALNDEAASLGQASAEHEALVAAEKEAFDNLRKSYRELDAESKINASKIDKSNEKLRAVKTNKEYQLILKEIEEIRKKNSGIEDRMIELLDQLEAQEGAVQQKEIQLVGFVQSCIEKKTAIADRVQQQVQAVERLNDKKEQIKASADPKTISILDDVKTKVRGMAVVPVEQAVCMGCHMNIPAQLYNELLRYDELRFCPHCNRIIYWKEKDSE